MVHRWLKQKYQNTKYRIKQSSANGFLLPVVIALGLGVGTVSVLSLQSVAQNSVVLNDQYYGTIAREAAQSGIAAVKACVLTEAGGWVDDNVITPSDPMTQTDDCQNNTDSRKPDFVTNGANYESSYEVTDVSKYDANPSTTTIVITSVGKVTVKGPLGTTVKVIPKTLRATATSVIPATGPVSKSVAKVSTGRATTCALTNPPDSWVYCWGSNTDGQVGAGRNVDDENRQKTPLAVASNATPIAAKGAHRPDGRACGGLFQPGCTISAAGAQPASAMRGKKVTTLSVGQTHACAVATDSDGSNGRAYCWGDNENGQLGDRTNTKRLVPVAVDTQETDITPPPKAPSPCGGFLQPSCTPVAQPTLFKSAIGGKDIVDVVAGDRFTCAQASDGVVACWGLNNHGQLGNDNRTDRNYPVDVSYGGPLTKKCVATGLFGNCTRYDPPENLPASALQGKKVKTLARLKGTAATMCVITTENRTVCWGENHAGQIGNGVALPPNRTGYGEDRNNSNNCTTSTDQQALDEARAALGPDITQYDILRPTQVQTTYIFSELLIAADSSGNTSYTHVTGKVSADSPSNRNRLFYWGGEVFYEETYHCQHSGGGADDNQHSTSEVTITRRHTGVSTPTGPLYNTSSDGELRNQLGLIAGNPVRGLFCATTLNTASPNQPYCDIHDGRANEGQLGNNYTCVDNNPFLDVCNKTWTTPLPLRLDLANDASTIEAPDNITSKQITSLDTSSTGFSCIVAGEMVYCWGVNSSGQIGDNTKSNRGVPTAAFYGVGSPLGIPGGNSADSGTFENPMIF